MSTGIVYFSKSNNTKTGAEYLSEKLGASITRLIDKKNLDAGAAIKHELSDLEGDPWDAIKDCDRVIVMSPIWAFSGVPAMDTFLQKADFTGKEIIIVTFSAFGKGFIAKRVHHIYTSKIEKAGGSVIGKWALKGTRPDQYAGDAVLHKRVDQILPEIMAL